MARPSGRPIRDEVIDIACRMVQEVGVNAFSYGALAAEVGVSAPSIHHHFRTKDDLVAAVAERYRLAFDQRLDEIAESGAVQRLHAYARLFAETSSKDLMCFCGSIAADWASVGDRARSEVSGFFEDQIHWVSSQIADGVASGELRRVNAPATAVAFVASLEGAMLMARSSGDTQLPHTIASILVDGLIPQQ